MALFPTMRLTTGTLDFETFMTCHTGTREFFSHDEFAYRITKDAVCIPRNFCPDFAKYFTCGGVTTWPQNSMGYMPIIGIENFSAVRNERLSDKKYPHWIIDIDDQSYFWSRHRASSRFFPIDPGTFKYLGGDKYQDKDGLIVGNTRK